MFDSIRLRYRGRKLRRLYKPYFAAARSSEELDQLRAKRDSEYCPLDEERRVGLQAKLLRRARRLLIPNPAEHAENREPSQVAPNRYLLTHKAVYNLSLEIRKAKKMRQELWLGWLPLLTALTGLVGTATGFLALWRK